MITSTFLIVLMKRGIDSKSRKTSKEETVSSGTVPACFVFKRGRIGRYGSQLSRDFREIMRPNTSIKLKERKGNKMRDFINICGPLGVTHLGVFAPGHEGVTFRVIRVPQGPTVHFKVDQYTLAGDLRKVQSAPRVSEEDFRTPPLVVLDGFAGGAPHLRLMSTMFRFMFPTLSVTETPLSALRRAVFFSHDAETGLVHVRHYGISLRDESDSAAMPLTALLERGERGSLDLGEYGSLAAYVAAQQEAAAPGSSKRRKVLALHELGPRLALRCIRIEDGVDGGAVLYHAHETKTAGERAALAARASQRKNAREKDTKSRMAAARTRKRAHVARAAAAADAAAGRQRAAMERLGYQFEKDGKVALKAEDAPRLGDSAELYRAPTRAEKKAERQAQREDRMAERDRRNKSAGSKARRQGKK